MDRSEEFYFKLAQKVHPDLSRESFTVPSTHGKFAFAHLKDYEIIHLPKHNNFSFSFNVKATYNECKRERNNKWFNAPEIRSFTFPVVSVVEREKVTERPSLIYEALLMRGVNVILLTEYVNSEITVDHFTEFMKANRITVVFHKEVESLV
jgi:hypothetical protein